MRTKPIGTGPFKFAEFKSHASIKLTRNAEYWKKGLPYLDAIEWRIVTSRSTRVLAFIAGEFDMLGYIATRIGYLIPVLIAVTLLTFLIASLLPGDLAHAMSPQHSRVYHSCASAAGAATSIAAAASATRLACNPMKKATGEALLAAPIASERRPRQRSPRRVGH